MSPPPKKSDLSKHRDPASIQADPSSSRSPVYEPKGTWNEFKGNARRLWSSLKPEDLDVPVGDYEEVINRIHGVSGEEPGEIRQKLFGE